MILVEQIVKAALIALLLAVAGCSTVDTQPTRPAPVPADQQDVIDDQQEIADDQQQRQQTDESRRKALKIIGGIVAAAATVYVITEYVKDEVIPAIVTLAALYLIVDAAGENRD